MGIAGLLKLNLLVQIVLAVLLVFLDIMNVTLLILLEFVDGQWCNVVVNISVFVFHLWLSLAWRITVRNQLAIESVAFWVLMRRKRRLDLVLAKLKRLRSTLRGLMRTWRSLIQAQRGLLIPKVLQSVLDVLLLVVSVIANWWPNGAVVPSRWKLVRRLISMVPIGATGQWAKP
jgi:hypothetical protein